MSFTFFLLTSIGYSILYTWVYNGTRGSLLMVGMLHAVNNATFMTTMIFFFPLIQEPIFSSAVLAGFDLLVVPLAGLKLLWSGPGQEGLAEDAMP